MRTVTITEARKQLSRLVDAAAGGEPFIITRGGKPLVKVVATGEQESRQPRRIGFLDGVILVPEDSDRMGSAALEALFREEE